MPSHFGPMPVRPTRLTTTLQACGWVCMLGLVLAAAECAQRSGVVVETLTKDPATVADDIHPNSGVLSIVGSIGWFVSAALLFLAASVRRPAGHDRAVPRALWSFGVIAAIWGLDDSLLLHDYWLLNRGVPEVVTFAVMAFAAVVAAVAHRKVVLRTDLVLLALAGLGFGMSIALDLPGKAEHLEDLAKLWAIGLLVVWSWRTARTAIDGPRTVAISAGDAVTAAIDLTARFDASLTPVPQAVRTPEGTKVIRRSAPPRV
jgi:hypothetical protein